MSQSDARRHSAPEPLWLLAGIQLTAHARQRLMEHGFREDEVLLAVVSPEQTYGCPERKYGPGRRMHQRGPLAVVIDTRMRRVITVLPRAQERWEHSLKSSTSRIGHTEATTAEGLPAVIARRPRITS